MAQAQGQNESAEVETKEAKGAEIFWNKIVRTFVVMSGEGKLLRIKEAAARLAVSARTVWRIIAAGELPVVHVRGCACIPEAALLAYEERNKRGGRA
jgi:excisionase family DNA binding protein